MDHENMFTMRARENEQHSLPRKFIAKTTNLTTTVRKIRLSSKAKNWNIVKKTEMQLII